MGKMKELSAILDSMVECGNALVTSANALKDLCENIVSCGNTLQNAANALKDFYSSVTEEEPKAALPKKETTPKKETEKTYTLEEVRAILSAKSKAGFREQVKEMITKRGVDNLTKLDSSEYPSLVKEVEGLTNG
ncbi:hypothetical protein [Clostridium cellulovorans]|uniref:rRNA biogenesis protein rrp5 n=1 Tax=Clostridium cellulovorans (strain ATCC 35296 / DSM 3052 / OCM 3 / 743B) TaxID=573061 RepID=D9SLM4_CLOC7|nr:hypothetical protein [Clostridium cellulovorans]ADL53661.1 hypothetical protein Clocel_3998 [Clostridium cellulovorans 743B]